MSGPLRRYVLGVAGLGTLAVGVFIVVIASGGREVGSPGRAVVLLAVSFVSVLLPLRFHRGGGSQGFHFEGSVLVAALLTIDPLWVPPLMTAAALVGHTLRTRDVLKSAFNIGQVALQTSAGTVAFVLVQSPGASATAVRSLLAAVLASVVYEIVSIIAMAELFHRVDGTARKDAAGEVGSLSLVTFAGNAAYGIVLATVLEVSVVVAVISGALMLGLYVGYRGYARAVSDRRRAESLNSMTHALIHLPAGDAGLGDFLQQVVATFGGRGGELFLLTPGGYRRWRIEADQVTLEPQADLPRSGIVAEAVARDHGLVRAAEGGESDLIVAPVRDAERPLGAIVVSGRRGLEPWDESDATLLSAIANELAVAMENMALFDQVEEERARLEAESTKLNDILTAATDGIVSILHDGVIEAWNPGMARITGTDVGDALGQPWHAVLRLQDERGRDLAPTGDHVLNRAIAGRHDGRPLSLHALRADGEWRRLACTVSSVGNREGTTRGLVLVARDVTTERELEDLKSDFIATVSHELRTPLTPLKGFLSTLGRAQLTEDQRAEIHEAMGSQVTRLEALIADLLAVAELDHGQFDLRSERLELGAAVSEAARIEAAAAAPRLAFELQPGTFAVVDRVALARVVRSLVANALKHTEGRVTVGVGQQADRVEVWVEDEGPGIAAWDLDRIFNRFERLGNHLTRSQGPGLGLSIARALARRMDGDVHVTSDLGQGARFVVALPLPGPRVIELRSVAEDA